MPSSGRPTRQRVGIGLILVSLLLTASGCWSAREIDDLAFVMAIGVDRAPSDESGLVVSFRVVNPSRLATGESGGTQSGGKQPTFSVIVKANSLLEAMDRFREQVPRRPFLSHIKAVIIGESLAREGITELLDFFERENEVRRSVNVLITKGQSATELFEKGQPELLTSSGLAIDGLLRHAPDVGHAPVTIIGDAVEQMNCSRQDSIASVISLAPNASNDPSQPSQLNLAGTAIFQERRMIGFLDEKETALLLTIRNELERTTVSIPEAEGVKADVRLRHIRSSVRVVDPRAPRFAIEARFEGIIQQLANTGAIDEDELVEITSRRTEAYLEERTTALIRRLQSLGSDALRFCDTLYRTDPHVWRDVTEVWDAVFPTIGVDVEYNVTVISSGNIIRGVSSR